MAATTGLPEFSTALITECRLGSCIDLSVPNSLMSAPPEKAPPAPVMTMAFDRCIGIGPLQKSSTMPCRVAWTKPADGRVRHGDHGNGAVDFVFKRTVMLLSPLQMIKKERSFDDFIVVAERDFASDRACLFVPLGDKTKTPHHAAPHPKTLPINKLPGLGVLAITLHEIPWRGSNPSRFQPPHRG